MVWARTLQAEGTSAKALRQQPVVLLVNLTDSKVRVAEEGERGVREGKSSEGEEEAQAPWAFDCQGDGQSLGGAEKRDIPSGHVSKGLFAQ